MTSSKLGIDTSTGKMVEIPKPSRLRGLYIIGAPGTGKSGLIENLIIQDIGVCSLDPHGDLTHAVLARLPDRRVKDGVNPFSPLRKKSGDTLNDKSGEYLMPVIFKWEDNHNKEQKPTQ